jgi:putative ABC transport system permease protein
VLSALLQDIRYALRLLRRSPALAITAVATLAVAIGANTAIFSAVQGVLLSPLPYPDPDRLVRLFEEAPRTPHFPVAPADFRDYRAELRTFEGLAAYVRTDLQLGDFGRPEQLRGMQVSSGFFSLLGHPPVLGRDFDPTDEIKGNDNVVILGATLWKRLFNADPAIVGRWVRLSGRMFRVIGVLPEGFTHVGGTYRTYRHGEAVDIWSVLPVPRGEDPRFRYSHYFNVVGRIARNASRADVDADLRRTAATVASRYPQANSPWKPRLVPLKDEIVGAVDSTLLVLSGAASAVLLLACVNIAGLLLGRASGRAREVGVRSALGATRWRLIRQLLVESVVLAAGGGALGVALAYGAVAAIIRFGPADLPRLQAIQINAQVLAAAVAATLCSAVLFGLAPALRLVRAGTAETLKDTVRTIAGSRHARTRRALAGTEVALAFVLVVSSGLLLRSFMLMLDTNPGFEARHALTASVELPPARYNAKTAVDFFRRATERVRALPGVQEVGFSSDLPWTNYDENTGFEIVGRKSRDEEGPEARYHFLTEGYTRAIGTTLIAGRDVTRLDTADAPPVVLLNEAAARKYWTTPDAAVGAGLDLWGARRTVVGVIGNVRDMPWQLQSAPALYFPQAQMWQPQPMFLVVRSTLNPTVLAGPIRQALREIDPELPLANVRLLETVAGAALATRRLVLWLVAAFGLTALFLAVIGVYGVMAQSVSERRHEFGVRQALGATRTDIMRLVFSTGAAMIAAGLLTGIAMALMSTRLLAALLYGITPLDASTFGIVAAILVAAAAAAAYVPSRRATTISAATALRAE